MRGAAEPRWKATVSPLGCHWRNDSVLVGKVAGLEGRLFDGEGHLRPGLTDELADTLLSEINDLRHDLGWLSLDLHHHQVWPAPLAS